jgi:hypothetical protein
MRVIEESILNVWVFVRPESIIFGTETGSPNLNRRHEQRRTVQISFALSL